MMLMRGLKFESEQHRRNVAALACAECRIEGYSQCAHANQAKWGKSYGRKASDIATFPLCCDRPGTTGCHTKHDQLIGMTKEEAEAREDRYIVGTLLLLAAMGKLRPTK